MSAPKPDSGIPVVEKLAADLHDQPEYCLRPHQRKEFEGEAQRLREVVQAPDWQAGQAKVAAQQRYRQVLDVLNKQAPRAVDDKARRDRIAKDSKEVLETVIKPAMLSRAEMRRNPAGAVGEFLKRENSPPIQRAIRTWQRAQFALEPDTEYDDHAFIEKHRPELPYGVHPIGTSTFMGDAQIPGVFAYGPLAKNNWPLPAPQNTAVEQVRRAESKPKRAMSEAQRAALAAGRAKRNSAPSPDAA